MPDPSGGQRSWKNSIEYWPSSASAGRFAGGQPLRHLPAAIRRRMWIMSAPAPTISAELKALLRKVKLGQTLAGFFLPLSVGPLRVAVRPARPVLTPGGSGRNLGRPTQAAAAATWIVAAAAAAA